MDSERVTLRPFRVSDVDDFILWAGDEQVTRTIRWKTITSKEEALTFIKEVCIPHHFCRSICIDDRSIGFVLVIRWSGGDRHKADIGYGVAAKYWGQGIATKAVQMVISEVFKDFPDLVRLQAFAAVENIASQRVLEKAGFTREGLLRKYAFLKGQLKDSVIYSLLSTDSNGVRSLAGELGFAGPNVEGSPVAVRASELLSAVQTMGASSDPSASIPRLSLQPRDQLPLVCQDDGSGNLLLPQLALDSSHSKATLKLQAPTE